VVLEFTVQGHRLRLTRSPEYERPKRNGTGYTTQRAKASLTWVGEAPSGHAPDGLTRIDEVARTVQRLLGMSAEQFFQVVLLPQGEFARFLRSETSEREQLLERLFGTERFADVERWFRDARQTCWQAMQEHRQRVRELVARVSQAAGQEPPTDDGDIENAPGESWLAAVQARLADEVVLAGKNDVQARETKERAESELRRQTELAGRVRRVRTATRTLADLADYADQRRSWADELAAARRAVPAGAAHQAVRKARVKSAAARQAEDRVVRSVRQTEKAVVDVAALLELPDTDGVGAVQWRARAVWEEVGGLAPLVTEAEALYEAEDRLAALVVREEKSLDSVRQLGGKLAAMPARLDAARLDLEASNRALSRLDGLTDRLTEARALHRDALRLPGAEHALETTRVAASDAVDRHQRAREALLDIRQRRLDGMAAELAGDLRAGEGCAVCGSLAHPAPAQPVEWSVVEADERAAAEAEQTAVQERERSAAAVTAADLRLTALRERLAGRTEAELSASLASVSALHDEATVAAGLAPIRAKGLAALQETAETLRVRLASTDLKHARLAADRATLAEQVRTRGERLASARGPFPDVVARRTHLLDVAALLDSYAETRAARLDLDTRQAELETALVEAAQHAGFADPADAIDAIRDDATITELAESLATADDRTAAARAVLAESELAGIDPDIEVDVELAQGLLAEAVDEAEGTDRALSAAQRRQHDVEQLAERLRRAWRDQAPVEAAYRQMAGLADVINGRGQNARKMSLRSYVLAARLADVAVAATLRLQQMSQGRYSFVHSDVAGPRGTRGGLGLDVLDDYSGLVRPAKTLSGGESFLASLSLALGLADVVAAETGGALLDTLFIDEGFGTLDADTLDQVMNTLDELRAGGRVVGVVSHVEELRQRIPVQLRVRKARSGSTVELIAG
jgi:exonuclease SbcC